MMNKKLLAQFEYMRRNPTSFRRYEACRKLPEAFKPTSPLIDYLESKGTYGRLNMGPVRLHPSLGYNSNLSFRNGEAMLRYLKPSEWVVGFYPAQTRIIHAIKTSISDELFVESQNSGVIPSHQ